MLTRLFPDMVGYRPRFFVDDMVAALGVTFLSVPQCIAYAMIAGLPPATGLYAAAVPSILGALFRSSSHVVAGPSNALSLLVGTGIAATMTDNAVEAALIIALMVGAFQIAAGVLKLGALVDYISTSVVAGYITGAGTLIAIGQLPNVTGTTGARGDVWTQVTAWIAGLAAAQPLAIGLALATGALILLIRWLVPKLPAAMVALGIGVFVSWLAALDQYGIRLARDIAPVPMGLPPLTIPDVTNTEQLAMLLPIAIAATVLSLVESSAVARSLASQTGQRIDSNREFIGQGLSNIGAAFFGGYPSSGSLSRSALNFRLGARSRVAGVMGGLLMIVVLLVAGPVVDLTPIACLAGLLMVVAFDLVDLKRIRAILWGNLGDKVGFVATVIGTWVLPLDQAIYLGVGISIVLFLRKARNLVVNEFILEDGRFVERENLMVANDSPIKVLHVEGRLFFGAANELQDALEYAIADENVKALVVRLKRTQGLDYTTAAVLEGVQARLHQQDRAMFLVGMRPNMMKAMRSMGTADRIGEEWIFPTEEHWFAAMDRALAAAVKFCGGEDSSPTFEQYLKERVDAEI